MLNSKQNPLLLLTKLRRIFAIFTVILVAVVATSCSKDDSPNTTSEFVVAFENPSMSLSGEAISQEVKIVFSEPAPKNGSLQILFQGNNLVYGTGFSTEPAASSGFIEVPVVSGSTQTSFVFTKLEDSDNLDLEKFVKFSFGEINVPNGIANGNTTFLVTFSETASIGGNFSPNVGGPNQPNQVYIDLSAQTETAVRRDTWDLKFYSGDEFRVKLNSSLFMMAAELPTTDLASVSESDLEDLESQMEFLVAGSNEYVDNPNGELNETAISEISINPTENKVYLLKMGYEIGTNVPEVGSVAISGSSRGWKKIRVLRQGNDYILQYADLNSASHQEIVITKDLSQNFTFFSIENQSIVNFEPENWDLNFTTFTEVEEFPTGGFTAYGYSDYVLTNVLSNVKAYQVMTSEIAYQEFTLSNVQAANFELDQRVIGSNWRNVFEATIVSDRFYIVSDPEGNQYKLRFLSMVDENGVRGYPKFEYELLN